jgi:hypothetical protein
MNVLGLSPRISDPQKPILGNFGHFYGILWHFMAF